MSWFGISLGLSIVLPQMLELYEQVLPFPISKPVHTQHQGLSTLQGLFPFLHSVPLRSTSFYLSALWSVTMFPSHTADINSFPYWSFVTSSLIVPRCHCCSCTVLLVGHPSLPIIPVQFQLLLPFLPTVIQSVVSFLPSILSVINLPVYIVPSLRVLSYGVKFRSRPPRYTPLQWQFQYRSYSYSISNNSTGTIITI